MKEIKIFQDKIKGKQFMSTKPAMQTVSKVIINIEDLREKKLSITIVQERINSI